MSDLGLHPPSEKRSGFRLKNEVILRMRKSSLKRGNGRVEPETYGLMKVREGDYWTERRDVEPAHGWLCWDGENRMTWLILGYYSRLKHRLSLV